MSLFDTGIRPHIDAYLAKKAAERRDYGQYWSASQAGYCMRKVIMERMGIPPVSEDARKQRVFEAGHIFHEWAQRITRDAGLSVAQELELQDEELMIRGHIDDLVLVPGTPGGMKFEDDDRGNTFQVNLPPKDHLILYDYKTQNSRAFTHQKGKPISHYHKMQLGTYMYMLRRREKNNYNGFTINEHIDLIQELSEARILKISKDDLRMDEQQLLWSPELEQEVYEYWSTLNGYWKNNALPRCTCADYEGGFMAKENYNPFFYNGEPCSQKWYDMHKQPANTG